MKKLYNSIFFWLIPFILFIFLLFFINILKKDFRYAHLLHNTYKDPHNWLYEATFIPVKKFYNKFINDKKEYFPQIKFYISESNLNYLLSDIPDSTKIWQEVKIVHDFYSDKPNKLRNGALRYKGDNPENWLSAKKAYRIKFKKRDMNERQRYYDYLPFEERLLTSYSIARNANILAPSVRPVELFINGENKGLYLEAENLNENFLRRNKLMPVNFYKGENYNQEAKTGLDSNLYNNSGLWTKDANFNFKDAQNNDDLNSFLNIFKELRDDKQLETFFSFIDDDYFSRYLAYLIIAQDVHHTNYHNNRIVIDPWRGKIFPVIVDPGSDDLDENKAVNFEYSSNDLISIFNQSSKYINMKYEYLHKFLYKENLLDKEINNLNKIKENIVQSLKREPFIHTTFLGDISESRLRDLINQKIEKIKRRKSILISNLSEELKATWREKDNKFTITLKSQMPINSIKLLFDKNVPEWVYIDENYNGKHDYNEKKYFKEKNEIIVDASFYANRIEIFSSFNFVRSNIETSMTKFDLITENGLMPHKIFAENKFTKKFTTLLHSTEEGSQTNSLNKIIHTNSLDRKVSNDLEVLSGELFVDKNLVFENPVIIKEGTTFYLSENASVIFKNKVRAIASNEKKIKFVRIKGATKPWGTVALLGNKTSGSILQGLEFEGGSGGSWNQYIFTSMLSIHDASNIEIKDTNFYNNYLFDDMMHIIYSKNIKLENLYFKNAFGDALDIDLSQNVIIKDSVFYNSRNDGIDLMESNVIIQNVKIKNSQDKSISVGEASVVKILDSELENNNIAIAVKDKSEANIESTKFLDNKKQLAAYKKNLQYGSGGIIIVKKSIFNSATNKLISESSTIDIKDTLFVGKISKEGKNIFINER